MSSKMAMFVVFLTLVALIVVLRWRQQEPGPEREVIQVPGVGRVQLATSEERAHWEAYYRQWEDDDAYGD